MAMAGQAIVMSVGGLDLLVETTPVAVVGTQLTSKDKLERAAGAVATGFDAAREAIAAVAESTVQTITTLGNRAVRPDEIEVKFGLKFSAHGNIVVAGASGEATLEISLTYRADQTKIGTGSGD